MHIAKLARCLEELSTSRTVSPDHRAAADVAWQLVRKVQAEYQIDWNAAAPGMLLAVENDLPLRSNDEETGAWIAIHYWPHEPAHVYGLFKSEHDARAYAEANGFAKGQGTYDIQSILNAHYQEDASDYVGMGWIGKDGKP